MRPSSHLQRAIAVLLLVSVWTLSLVWHERCHLDEEQQLAAHGPCEGANVGPATETPKFSIDDESRNPLDDDSLIDPTLPRAMRVVADLDRPAIPDAVAPRHHHTPRIARGPPTLA